MEFVVGVAIGGVIMLVLLMLAIFVDRPLINNALSEFRLGDYQYTTHTTIINGRRATPEEAAKFDEVFAKSDEAFRRADEAFRAADEAFKKIRSL